MQYSTVAAAAAAVESRWWWCGVKEIGHAIAVAACSGPVQFSNPRHVTASSVFFSYHFPSATAVKGKGAN